MKKKKINKRLKYFVEFMVSCFIVFSIFYSRNVYGKLFIKVDSNMQIETNTTTQNTQTENISKNQETEQNKKVILSDNEMTAEIDKILSEYQVNQSSKNIGMVYKNLKTGYTYSVNETEYFPMASTTKVIYAMYIYDRIELGQLSEDTKIKYKASHLSAGNGEITNNAKKSEYNLDYIIMNMLTYSDNTATNMILGTNANATQLLNNFFNNKFSVAIPEKNSSQNKLTVNDMANVWMYLYENQSKYPKVIEYLKNSSINEWIKEGIKNKEIASKYGQIPSVANNTAIVFDSNKGDFLLLIYTQNLSKAEKAITEISEKINKLHDDNA